MVLLMAVILTTMAASSLPGNGAAKAGDTRLPWLSESVDSSSAKAAENQTENSTAPVTSSGAVKASFTVVESPAGVTLPEAKPPPAASPATSGRPKGTRSTVPQRASADTEAGYQQTPTDQSSTPKPAGGLGGSAMGWILFFSIWSLEIVMVLGFAFVRGWARR